MSDFIEVQVFQFRCYDYKINKYIYLQQVEAAMLDSVHMYSLVGSCIFPVCLSKL